MARQCYFCAKCGSQCWYGEPLSACSEGGTCAPHKKDEQATVILVQPQSEPRELVINGDEKSFLKPLQALVGGYIEGIHLDDEIDGYVNEEGLLQGLPPNVLCPTGALLVGPIVFTRTNDEGYTVSVQPGDIDKVKAWLKDCKRPGRYDYGL